MVVMGTLPAGQGWSGSESLVFSELRWGWGLYCCNHVFILGFLGLARGRGTPPPHTVPAEAHPVLGALLSTGAPPVPELFKF